MLPRMMWTAPVKMRRKENTIRVICPILFRVELFILSFSYLFLCPRGASPAAGFIGNPVEGLVMSGHFHQFLQLFTYTKMAKSTARRKKKTTKCIRLFVWKASSAREPNRPRINQDIRTAPPNMAIKIRLIIFLSGDPRMSPTINATKNATKISLFSAFSICLFQFLALFPHNISFYAATVFSADFINKYRAR